MKTKIILAIFSCLVINCELLAQTGLPPKKKTTTRHVTKYPQHLDFLPGMVKLLKVPDGWEIKFAGSGLGLGNN